MEPFVLPVVMGRRGGVEQQQARQGKSDEEGFLQFGPHSSLLLTIETLGQLQGFARRQDTGIGSASPQRNLPNCFDLPRLSDLSSLPPQGLLPEASSLLGQQAKELQQRTR